MHLHLNEVVCDPFFFVLNSVLLGVVWESKDEQYLV